MKLLFPCHPLKPTRSDPDYEQEVVAAQRAGFECQFFDLEILREGEATRSLAQCSKSSLPAQTLMHRGWMMSDTLYSQLHATLLEKGYVPITNPAQYTEAHYLPNAYPKLIGLTPESKWMVGKDIEEAWKLYQDFSHAPALVKDFVKSAKHRWNEACFIPAQTNRQRFEEIIRAFLEARGHQFNKGIVFRRYHELVTLERDLRGQPVHEEYRLFFWKGRLLAAAPSLFGNGPFEEIEKWTEVARRFENQFISMDIARQQDGSWLIIEVGDGGVSGLPFSIEADTFYGELFRQVSNS